MKEKLVSSESELLMSNSGGNDPTINPLQLRQEDELMQYKQKNVTWTQILGGSVGNILEWYDFAGQSIYILPNIMHSQINQCLHFTLQIKNKQYAQSLVSLHNPLAMHSSHHHQKLQN